MKKFLPLIILLQLILLVVIFIILTRKKEKFTELDSEDAWYFNPVYKKHFKKIWKKDVEKLKKELKNHENFETQK